MILEYIKKVIGIAQTTPSDTLVDWCTVNNTPSYQRKCDKNENCGSHATLLWLGASFGVPFQLQEKPKACRSPLKHLFIIPQLKKYRTKIKTNLFSLSFNPLLATSPLIADSISITNKYTYAENAGWLNFNSTHEQVTVYNDHLEGYVWSEAIGWIRLGNLLADNADSNGVADIFLNHIASQTQIRVSYQEDGSQIINPSSHPSISGDTPYLVYDRASSLSQQHIYGVNTLSAQLEGIQYSGEYNNFGEKINNTRAAISADGRFIAYLGQAQDNSTCTIHLLDKEDGSLEMSLCSQDIAENPDKWIPSFDADARTVIWQKI